MVATRNGRILYLQNLMPDQISSSNFLFDILAGDLHHTSFVKEMLLVSFIHNATCFPLTSGITASVTQGKFNRWSFSHYQYTCYCFILLLTSSLTDSHCDTIIDWPLGFRRTGNMISHWGYTPEASQYVPSRLVPKELYVQFTDRDYLLVDVH